MLHKKEICFIAVNDFICEGVKQQLVDFLGQYVSVVTWCLNSPYEANDFQHSDIYLLASQAVFEEVKYKLPQGAKIIIAKRTLEIDSLDEILTLPVETEALVISPHEETSNEKINLLYSFGLDKLTLYPYWPGRKNYPRHVKIAITTGQHPVPPEIQKVVNVGIRTLALSTFMEIIVELNLPLDAVNIISNHYISAIINLATKRLIAIDQNERLSKRLQVILDTVNEAIIAVDKKGTIEFVNPAFLQLLNINSNSVMGAKAYDILPELDFLKVLMDSEKITDSIQVIRNKGFVVDINPIYDQHNNITGAMSILKAIDQVQELDTKVRRELKRKGHVAKHYFKDIIGESKGIKKIIDMAERYARTDLAVLIEGASGTGKELLAQSIHNTSNRRNSPFVAVNFAALPENLVESELFGYEDGAFTGAKKGGRTGLFEEAHTGTILLDEIGDASKDVQKKLLRVLEEKEIRRVGGSTVIPVDVRVIAATNQNLRKLVLEGKFREDLFFRLCTIQLIIPPLRERREDILPLISFYARHLYNRELLLDKPLQEYLCTYSWPGNVRELQNVVKFLCGMVDLNERAGISHIPEYLISDTLKPEEIIQIQEENPNKTKIEIIIYEFKRVGAFQQLYWIMKIFYDFHMFNKGIGRYTLVEMLKDKHLPCPEHKIRSWIKILEKTGCIATGSTKQGSRITEFGEKVYVYLEKNYSELYGEKGKFSQPGG